MNVYLHVFISSPFHTVRVCWQTKTCTSFTLCCLLVLYVSSYLAKTQLLIAISWGSLLSTPNIDASFRLIDLVIELNSTFAFPLLWCRTLSSSDDVQDRETEKGRLEEAFETCDRDLDKLIVQHYAELTTAIRTYQSITERITSSRNKIKQVETCIPKWMLDEMSLEGCENLY